MQKWVTSPILQKKKLRLREVELPNQVHKKNLGGARTQVQNSRLLLFITSKPPAKTAHSLTFCTLAMTSNTVC